MRSYGWLFGVLLAGGSAAIGAKGPVRAAVRVSSQGELTSALDSAGPGTVIEIAPGTYRQIVLRGVSGTAEAPIILRAADPDEPPTFRSGSEGVKLTDCAYVKLSRMRFTGFSDNGIKIDDGGTYETPSHHIILEHLRVVDTGPQGNHDALKLSGAEHIIVRSCRFEGWGGSGIDMVGCHNALVADCRFIGRKGYRQKAGIQIKGGSSRIVVQGCFFHEAGERAVCIGGSTGLKYFRPRGAAYEAEDVVVAGNRFVGGESHISWLTARGGRVHHNIFYLPGKWVGRITEETRGGRLKPCRDGAFEHNLVVIDRRVRTVMNYSAGIDESSVVFRHNAWFGLDTEITPQLPAGEIDGIYQVYPRLAYEGTARMRITADEPRLNNIGPQAYEPWRPGEGFPDVVPPPAGGQGPEVTRQGAIAYVTVVLGTVVLAAAALVIRRRRRRVG